MKRACHKYQPRIRRVITCFKRDSTPFFKSFFLFLVHHVKDYVWNHTQLADPHEDQLAPPQSPSVTPFTVFWSLWNLPSHKGWSCTRSWQSSHGNASPPPAPAQKNTLPSLLITMIVSSWAFAPNQWKSNKIIMTHVALPVIAPFHWPTPFRKFTPAWYTRNFDIPSILSPTSTARLPPKPLPFY